MVFQNHYSRTSLYKLELEVFSDMFGIKYHVPIKLRHTVMTNDQVYNFSRNRSCKIRIR